MKWALPAPVFFFFLKGIHMEIIENLKINDEETSISSLLEQIPI